MHEPDLKRGPIVSEAIESLIPSIHWDEKKCLSGSARHVPAALRDLLSDKLDVIERAYWKLDNHVVVQSDLFEAAYFVIPILLQMLRQGIAKGRGHVYDLLFEIGNGHGPDGETLVTAEGEKVLLRVACRREIRRGVELFEADLHQPDQELSQNARDLLECLAQED